MCNGDMDTRQNIARGSGQGYSMQRLGRLAMAWLRMRRRVAHALKQRHRLEHTIS